MRVNINNKGIETDAKNLSGLMLQLDLHTQGLAVAVGNKLVRRTDWENYMLEEGMQITVIKAACGG